MKVREFALLLLEHAPPDADIKIGDSDEDVGGISVWRNATGTDVNIMPIGCSFEFTSAEEQERIAIRAQEAAEEEVRRARERKAALQEKLAGWGLTEADLPEAPT